MKSNASSPIEKNISKRDGIETFAERINKLCLEKGSYEEIRQLSLQIILLNTALGIMGCKHH